MVSILASGIYIRISDDGEVDDTFACSDWISGHRYRHVVEIFFESLASDMLIFADTLCNQDKVTHINNIKNTKIVCLYV